MPRNSVETTEDMVKAIVSDLTDADLETLKKLFNSDYFVLIVQNDGMLTARTNYETEEDLYNALVLMKERGDLAMELKKIGESIEGRAV